ncbi:MAG: M23 family metallopeptidase [Bacteroidetes bacterium]|nr:M23 family metallopeptidase [Bacteroidota bacterium]
MRKTLSSWLTTNYLMIIRNEDNFAEKTTIRFNYARILSLIFLLLIILFSISFLSATTFLKEWFDPRHSQMEMNRQLRSLWITVDSLSDQVDRKEASIGNFQRIVAGEDSVIENFDDRLITVTSNSTSLNDEELAPVDSMFRKEFETSGLELLRMNSSESDLQEIFLFSPIEGIISDSFNPKTQHYGIDIVSRKNEPVKSVADGTVILASWTQDAGYIITIQHQSNLISVYKHNSDILKQVGNFVSAGEIVSIIGNTGELTSGPHLHFELWYNGSPINPEEFVIF